MGRAPRGIWTRWAGSRSNPNRPVISRPRRTCRPSSVHCRPKCKNSVMVDEANSSRAPTRNQKPKPLVNLPNKLTVSRFVLTGAFLVVMFSGVRYHQSIGLVLFSLASYTDFLDGKIARRDKIITNFGILMDPLAD